MNQLLRLWGKTGRKESEADQFHPALYHMLDAGFVARALLSEPSSPRWRNVLATACDSSPKQLYEWLPWLIAAHDIGKISAPFQTQVAAQQERLTEEGFSFGNRNWKAEPAHTLVGQVFFRDELQDTNLPQVWRDIFRDVCGAHHGYFASPVDSLEAKKQLRREPGEWREFRLNAFQTIKGKLLLHEPDPWPEPKNLSAAIMAITGFTILCDWLASNSDFFEICPNTLLADYPSIAIDRASQAIQYAGFAGEIASAIGENFPTIFPELTPPRPLQASIDEIPRELLIHPSLTVIEAPTGEGKTEAALALAHRIGQIRGTDEFYYALPTTATSNQLFVRVQKYLRDNLKLSTQAKLIHGQAFLIEDDLRMKLLGNGDAREGNKLSEWFGPKKRALLAPFGVGTIDQAELAALNVRHTPLRLIGLAGKTLIIDEVHAYDVYMTTIIERLLNWLAALNTSVILLSATLPLERRDSLLNAYCVGSKSIGIKKEYPAICTISSSGKYFASPPAYNQKREIELRPLHFSDKEPEQKAKWLIEQVLDGGCICWICNTVDRAQRLYQQVNKLAPETMDRMLLHARFPLEEREYWEQQLVQKYGPGDQYRPKHGGIVIGTQVLEQSLDLDFDVMVSDLAPIDLLLQRAGRMHRHQRNNRYGHSNERFFVNLQITPEGDLNTDADGIYPEYILMKTWELVGIPRKISLPADYRPLIEAVYSPMEDEIRDELVSAWENLKKKEAIASDEANLRLLPAPNPVDSFCGPASRLQFEEDENRANWIVAQTRLGAESVNIIPLERDGNIAKATLKKGEELSLQIDKACDPKPELNLLRRSLRISHRGLVKAIKATSEQQPPLFTKSRLLKDYFPLWLTQGKANLATGKFHYQIHLDPMLGLCISRKKGDA